MTFYSPQSNIVTSEITAPVVETVTSYTDFTEGVDAPFDLGTFYSIGVGDRFFGSLTSGDRDAIRITLVAGETYTISLEGAGSGAGTLLDTMLSLFDSTGTWLASDDDGGLGLDSLLTFTATYSGSYFLGLQSFGDAYAGSYVLSLISGGTTTPTTPTGPTINGTYQELATYLTTGYWNDSNTSPHRWDMSSDNIITVNLTGLTATGQQFARWAMEAWSMVANIRFSEITSGSADITFIDDNPNAYASTSFVNGFITTATINISEAWINNQSTLDTYAMQTYLHELGHALGLGHLGNYNGEGFTYANHARFINDSWLTSVMSYWSQDDNTNETGSFGYIFAPMIADIIAIQDLYGAPTAVSPIGTNTAGDTNWGPGSDASGGFFQDFMNAVQNYVVNGGATTPGVYNGGAVSVTIYDQGGTDTLDFSFLTQAAGDQYIDLGPAGFSNILGGTRNLVIAEGTIIENASLGAGNDTIIGNDANNILSGGAGNDSLNGGNGTDTAAFSGALSSYFLVSDGTDTWIADQRRTDGMDRITSIENAAFSDGTVGIGSITLFNGMEYIASHGDLRAVLGADEAAGLSHYFASGFNEGRGITFDGLQYIASHADLSSVFGADASMGASHYITNGLNEGRQITFDGLEYIASHRDLIAVFGTNTTLGTSHYITNGRNEGRGITFDGLEYIASHADLIGAFGVNAEAGTQHFIVNGVNEGRGITFDGLEYIASHRDLIAVFGVNAEAGTQHFIISGTGEGRQTTFDGLEYIASYADLIAVFGLNAEAGTQHFILNGVNEGRQVTFDGQAYLNAHADLQAAFGNNVDAAVAHYIAYGAAEGRSTGVVSGSIEYDLTTSVPDDFIFV